MTCVLRRREGDTRVRVHIQEKAKCGHSKKAAICNLRREFLGETKPVTYLDLGILALRKVREKNLFLSHREVVFVMSALAN